MRFRDGPPAGVESVREAVLRLGLTKPQILESNLFELLLPALEGDFAAANAYRYIKEAPLDVPITVIAGSDDPTVDAEGLASWTSETTGPVEIVRLPGSHLFEPGGLSSVTATIASAWKV
jgi:surfactin synthase thioesterase subunit